MTYPLSQGPKSELVASPKDWPGACSAPGLLGDMTVPARYKPATAEIANAWLHGTDDLDAFEVPF